MSNYRFERELQEEIEGLLLSILPSEGERVYRREVPMGDRIPDFVCISFKNLSDEDVLPKNCTYRHAAVLATLRQRRRTQPAALAKRLYTDVDRLQPLLKDLIASGAVVENPTGSLSLSVLWAELRAEVIAVEAKLTRWKDALIQAISHKRYADAAVVAMDAATTPRKASSIQAFADQGVGLCAISPNSAEWIVEPKRREGRGHEREYLLTSALTSSQTLWSRL